MAEESGAIARRYFRTPIAVDAKDDQSPVTIADREVEAAIRRLIAAECPGHGIVGEEHGVEHADAEYVWVIDPIDGTRAFIAGMPLFGILIALLRNGTPILGVIDQPISRERWIGVAGQRTRFRAPSRCIASRTGPTRCSAASTCPRRRFARTASAASRRGTAASSTASARRPARSTTCTR